ncbi:co-chaperone YbbN [Methanolobus vulcani]|jgi:thioredoxin-like negative regulator of GroEL|uniref:Thioredoxin family protein n=1 Tax=Methanolobus vulcani TaxID=38026 RepID=A0A7Z8KRB8_9EURY|nr:thioredoxin family protein [Methanolobus vulcani]TQD29205.1 thioredoxin family protein [Methanolobus vulcani]
MAESDIIEANDSNWQELIENQEKPMVVMFYLPNCVHCKEIEPYFKDYSVEFHKSCTFVMMNGLDSPLTARKYGVRGTPTFKFFCKGRAIKEQVGLVYPSLLRQSIEDLIRHGDECVLHTSPMPDEVSPYE